MIVLHSSDAVQVGDETPVTKQWRPCYFPLTTWSNHCRHVGLLGTARRRTVTVRYGSCASTGKTPAPWCDVFKPRPIGESAVDEMYYTILMSDRFGEEQRSPLAGLPVGTGGILGPWLRAYASHRTGSLSSVLVRTTPVTCVSLMSWSHSGHPWHVTSRLASGRVAPY